MKVFIVCSNDLHEQYGCYIDSVWSKKKCAEKRQRTLNESEEYSYDEPWYIEKFNLRKDES